MTTLATVLLQYGPHGPHAPHGPHGPGPGAGWMPGGAGPWFGMGLGAWLWLAALLVVVAGAVLVLARVDRPASDGSDPALARLRERYAAGALDDEEYRRRYARLTTDDDAPPNGTDAGT